MHNKKEFFEKMYSFFNQIMSKEIVPTVADVGRFFDDSFEIHINTELEASSPAEMREFMVNRQKSFKSWRFTLKELLVGDDERAATYHTIDIVNLDGSQKTNHISSIWHFKNGKIIKWFAIMYPPLNQK